VAVADDDRGTVDRRRQPGGHPPADLRLRVVLGLLVVVVERRSDLEIILAERAGVATADIAGTEIVKSLKPGTSCDRVQHIAGSLDVDPNRKLALHRQVVHGSEMPDLGHVVQAAPVEAKPWLGDVSFQQVDATR